jgi:hypothetical protein
VNHAGNDSKCVRAADILYGSSLGAELGIPALNHHIERRITRNEGPGTGRDLRHYFNCRILESPSLNVSESRTTFLEKCSGCEQPRCE